MINNKIDLVVSFDTTGSMYPVLRQVRAEVEKFVKQMFSEFTDLRLGIIAHGDYCDAGDPYTIINMELTRDEKRLCKFIKDVKQTYGGDADECYELVLNSAHENMLWRPDADKIMIMIGDASPHGVHYSMNERKLDWEKEAQELAKLGVRVFAVHALSYYRKSSKEFYETVAKTTDGTYLTLDQFNEIIELIKATLYQQSGEEKLNEYITIIKDSGKMTNSLNRNFRRLKGEAVEDDYRDVYRSKKTGEAATIKEMGKLVPVLPGRFQVMTVARDVAIKAFVEDNGIKFKTGRGFYELTKAVKVQQYKEIIIQDKETGEMFNGTQVREKLGLKPQTESGGVTESLHKDALKEFRVFIQSTSVNRKLIPGTTFLYEVDDIEDTGTTVVRTEDTSKKDEVFTEITTECIEIPVVDEEKKEEANTKAEKALEKAKRAKEKEERAKEKEERAKIKHKKALEKEERILARLKKKEEEAKKAKELDTKKLEESIEKANEAIERINKSIKNKKNRVYFKNNIEKLMKECEKMLDFVDKYEE